MISYTKVSQNVGRIDYFGFSQVRGVAIGSSSSPQTQKRDVEWEP